MRRFFKDNRGAGIVSVLISVLLITALGATLLFTSYTGLLVKVSDRRSTESFYSAETAMSEIRAGIQEAVTESIAAAYSEVLVSYNTAMDTEGEFHQQFERALMAWRYSEGEPPCGWAENTNVGGHKTSLFTAVGGAYSYDPEVLEYFISQPGGVTVGGGGIVRADDERITLSGVTVQYVEDGFETNISADISVSMPDFTYSLSAYSLTGVPEYALIAETALVQSTGGDLMLQLQGNAYAGRIDLSGHGTTLTVSGGTLISAGDVNVSGEATAGGYRLVMGDDTALWARRVVVGGIHNSTLTTPNTAVKLSGETYVADDLELAARNSRAVLSGRYYGFGDSVSNSAQSSAIVINGRETTLDMSQLSVLMLAGHSFINTGGVNSANDVLMGQSVSVRSDQLAYLAPADRLEIRRQNLATNVITTIENPTNPYFFDNSVYALVGDTPAMIDADKPLWSEKADSTLQKYGATLKQLVYKLASAPSQSVAYYYLVFSNTETNTARDNANRYFADYFSLNSEAVAGYLGLYSTALSALSAGSRQTSGATYDLVMGEDGEDGEDDELLLLSATGAVTQSARRLQGMYANLCVTLSSSIVAPTGVTTPFDYVVNSGRRPDETMVFKDGEGDIVGRIVIGDYTVEYGETASIIVATGDVTVDYDFTGLIIAQGVITMNRNISANATNVNNAMLGTNDRGETLLSYLNLVSDTGGGAGGDPSQSSWDTDALVGYANWRKY